MCMFCVGRRCDVCACVVLGGRCDDGARLVLGGGVMCVHVMCLGGGCNQMIGRRLAWS